MSKIEKADVQQELIKQSAKLQSALTEKLFVIGNKIAEKNGYTSIYGIEAVQHYLIQKHNWLPSQVKSMSMEDLDFCIQEDPISK